MCSARRAKPTKTLLLAWESQKGPFAITCADKLRQPAMDSRTSLDVLCIRGNGVVSSDDAKRAGYLPDRRHGCGGVEPDWCGSYGSKEFP